MLCFSIVSVSHCAPSTVNVLLLLLLPPPYRCKMKNDLFFSFIRIYFIWQSYISRELLPVFIFYFFFGLHKTFSYIHLFLLDLYRILLLILHNYFQFFFFYTEIFVCSIFFCRFKFKLYK